MGYRSEVVIAVKTSVYEDASDEVKSPLLGYFGDSTEVDGILYFHHDYIKWDMFYTDIETIDNWLKTLDYEDYAFMRLGEDIEDNEDRGACSELGVYLTRSISFPREI